MGLSFFDRVIWDDLLKDFEELLVGLLILKDISADLGGLDD